MKQPAVNSNRLARQLEAAIRRKGVTYEQVAKESGINASRISRFCAAEFKRVTPVLKKLCLQLHVPWQECVADPNSEIVAKEILESVRTLVGKDPKRAKAVRRLIRSVELLVRN